MITSKLTCYSKKQRKQEDETKTQKKERIYYEKDKCKVAHNFKITRKKENNAKTKQFDVAKAPMWSKHHSQENKIAKKLNIVMQQKIN